MRGDRLLIEMHHRTAAVALADRLQHMPPGAGGPRIVTIAGESGAGKSETAAALAEELDRRKLQTRILQQDDYFEFPPKTNAARRREDITRVGPQEVRLDLLTEHVNRIRRGDTLIETPLVIYDEDRIDCQTIDLSGIHVVIVEGTYTSLLEPVDLHVFIDRTNRETQATRSARAREPQTEFLERVLEIEHEIIASHKERADVVIASDYTVAEPGNGS